MLSNFCFPNSTHHSYLDCNFFVYSMDHPFCLSHCHDLKYYLLILRNLIQCLIFNLMINCRDFICFFIHCLCPHLIAFSFCYWDHFFSFNQDIYDYVQIVFSYFHFSFFGCLPCLASNLISLSFSPDLVDLYYFKIDFWSYFNLNLCYHFDFFNHSEF